MTQEVFHYHSGLNGAPSTTLVALGGLTALLDACLVNGFNSNSVASITRSGSTVTVTTSAAHNRAVGQQVGITDANETAYNDTWWITSVPTTTTLTFDIGAATPATPATGTISAKTPGAGWTKSFSGTNMAVYTAGSGSSGISMQVEDNNPYTDSNASARTRIVAGASGIPDSGSVLGEQDKILKANGAWVLVADKKSCYLIMNATNTFMFGDFKSFLSGDIYQFFQNRGATASGGSYYGTTSTGTVAGSNFPQCMVAYDGTTTTYPAVVLRDTTQLITNALATPMIPPGRSMVGSLSAQNAAFACLQPALSPNLSDGSVVMMPIPLMVSQSGGNDIRGMLRGMYWPLGLLATGSFDAQKSIILDDIVIGGALRKVLVTRFGYTSSGQIAFDLGPSWA